MRLTATQIRISDETNAIQMSQLTCGLKGAVENNTLASRRYRLNTKIHVLAFHFCLHTKSTSCLRVMRCSYDTRAVAYKERGMSTLKCYPNKNGQYLQQRNQHEYREDYAYDSVTFDDGLPGRAHSCPYSAIRPGLVSVDISVSVRGSLRSSSEYCSCVIALIYTYRRNDLIYWK